MVLKAADNTMEMELRNNEDFCLLWSKLYESFGKSFGIDQSKMVCQAAGSKINEAVDYWERLGLETKFQDMRSWAELKLLD